MNNSIVANEADFYFERGGPSYRLMQRLGVIQGDGPSVERRIVFSIAVTWIPLLLFAFLDGRALGPTPRESMLLDFATYARFFLAVPLLIIADLVVGPRLTAAGLRFIRDGFVSQSDVGKFSAAVARVQRRREALLPELIIAGIAFLGAWYLSVDQWYVDATSSWKSLALSSGRISLAGVWYQCFAIPFLQFLFLRWIWRLVIWTLFLYEMATLDLNLVVTHADQAGGLGFLGTAHSFLGIFSFGTGAIVSADAAFRIYFEAATIESFQLVFVGYIVLNEILFVGPLLVFLPGLFQARLEGLRQYSALMNQYNRAFHQRWVKNEPSPEEPLLGTADIQSLADLGNSFDRVRAMRDFPFGTRLILQIAVMAALPALPLALLVVPLTDILKLLGAAIL
jgi:hypothetical protein